MSDEPFRDSRIGRLELTVLDPDPCRAEEAYKLLRRELILYASWLGCHQARDVADEAIYRGLTRLANGVDTAQSTPRAYVRGVALKVAQEGWKREHRAPQLDPVAADLMPSPARDHAAVEARLLLRQTLKTLDRRDRRILLRYCTEDDRTKLYQELDVTPGNLRLIVHRIRKKLHASLKQ